jgi:hypothetical protein
VSTLRGVVDAADRLIGVLPALPGNRARLFAARLHGMIDALTSATVMLPSERRPCASGVILCVAVRQPHGGGCCELLDRGEPARGGSGNGTVESLRGQQRQQHAHCGAADHEWYSDVSALR